MGGMAGSVIESSQSIIEYGRYQSEIQSISYAYNSANNTMSYFENSNFIASLIKSQGVSEYFTHGSILPMMVHVEMQTRLVLETAIKFMRKDGRQRLEAADIELAARAEGHGEMMLVQLPKSRGAPGSKITINKLVDCCGFNLGNRIESEQAKGRWIYYQGKVVRDTSSSAIRKLRMQDYSVSKLAHGQFNAISFSEQFSLSKEETDYLSYLQTILKLNMYEVVREVVGCVPRIFPLYLHLGRHYPNEAGVRFMVSLFNSFQIEENLLLFHLPRLMEVLLVYRGPQSYAVGRLIAQVVTRYRHQQPSITGVMGDYREDYSFILKAIAYEQELGIAVIKGNIQRLIRKLIANSENGNQMAALCFRTLMRKSASINAFEKQNAKIPLWLPSVWLQNDKYYSI